MRATGERPWLVWLLSFSAFFLLGSAWAIALPSNGTYDENQHVVRAYAVVDAQLLPSGEGMDAAGLPAETFVAPRSLLPANPNCTWRPKPAKPASCQRTVSDHSQVAMPSQAARYNPVYYALVGWPLLASPDFTGVIRARLLSVLWAALLLATAFTIAWRLHRLMAAAVTLVATPMVMNLAGAINPNGLEICAGILLFVAVLALLRTEPARTGSPLVVGAAAAASVLLLVVRQIGPVLFCCVVLCCVVAAGKRSRTAGLLSSRMIRLSVGLPIGLAGAFVAWWTWYSRGADLDPVEGKGLPYSAAEVAARLPGERLRFYVEQVVGQFGYGETTVSPLLIVAWYALFAAVVVPALLLGGARLRIAVVGVVVICLAILCSGEIYFVPIVGWFSHSRYVAPLGVGVVLLAAADQRVISRLHRGGWLGLPVTLLVAATVPLHLYALVRVISRFRVGITAGFDPFAGSWDPPFGPFPPLLAALAGASVLVVLLGRSGGLRFASRRAWQTEEARKDVLG